MAEPMFRIVASTRKPGTCNSCHAKVTWVTTYPKGKAMPLHGDPVALKTDTDLVLGTIEYIASADSHFTHCPDAKKWSKK